MGKVDVSSFLRAPRERSDTAGRQGIGRRPRSRGVTRPTFGRRGFSPVPVHAIEGGCLDSFASVSLNYKRELACLNNMFRSMLLQEHTVLTIQVSLH